MDDEPPSNPANDDDEFQRDWARMHELLNEPTEDLLEPEMNELTLKKTAAMQAFLLKHRQRLESTENPRIDAAVAAYARQEELLKMAIKEYDKIEQKLLDSTAQVAETKANLIANLYHVMRCMEKASPEQWDKLEWAEREKQKEWLQEMQAHMPELLAELPIERRRELEDREK